MRAAPFQTHNFMDGEFFGLGSTRVSRVGERVLAFANFFDLSGLDASELGFGIGYSMLVS